jgi:hypothetical protein
MVDANRVHLGAPAAPKRALGFAPLCVAFAAESRGGENMRVPMPELQEFEKEEKMKSEELSMNARVRWQFSWVVVFAACVCWIR